MKRILFLIIGMIFIIGCNYEFERGPMMDDEMIMSHGEDMVENYLSLTVFDKQKKEVVKNAMIKLDVTGPDNNMQSKKAMTMSGNGMFHYGSAIAINGKGTLKVNANIMIKDKEYMAQTEFMIK